MCGYVQRHIFEQPASRRASAHASRQIGVHVLKQTDRHASLQILARASLAVRVAHSPQRSVLTHGLAHSIVQAEAEAAPPLTQEDMASGSELRQGGQARNVTEGRRSPVHLSVTMPLPVPGHCIRGRSKPLSTGLPVSARPTVHRHASRAPMPGTMMLARRPFHL